jgi:hypothetical protein
MGTCDLGLVFEVEITILVAIDDDFCVSGVLLCLVDDPRGASLLVGDGLMMDDSRRVAFEVVEVVELASALGVMSACDVRDAEENMVREDEVQGVLGGRTRAEATRASSVCFDSRATFNNSLSSSNL